MAPLLLRFPIAALIVVAVALFAATSATARPCRTFLISSYSIRNPSTNTFATVTEIRSLSNNPLFLIDDRYDQNDVVFSSSSSRSHSQHDLARASLTRAPLGFSTYDFSSLRDRTKDILSVVLALLFGFGCGSLAAAAMYLLWSVLAGRRDYSYDEDSSSSSDGEIESPKFDYVKVPAAEPAAAAPSPPPAAKDSSV